MLTSTIVCRQRNMAGLIVYFAVTSLLVVGASEYAQEFIDDQVRHEHHSPPLPPGIQPSANSRSMSHCAHLLRGPMIHLMQQRHAIVVPVADGALLHARAGCGPCTARHDPARASREHQHRSDAGHSASAACP